MAVDRRRMLQSILGAILAASGARARPATARDAPQSNASFGAVSAVLTGYPAPSDADAAKLLGAFGTPPRRDALTRLARVVSHVSSADLDVALRAQGLDGVANELVAAWFSGLVTQGATSKVVLYGDAYMWSAMSFTKPMGRCGGVTNYWAEPPA
jgi:Membrane bound FAD containing D-sorbitol dehydrogenase